MSDETPHMSMSAPEQCPHPVNRCNRIEGHSGPCSAQRAPKLDAADLRECQHDPPCCAEHCNACNLLKIGALRDTIRAALGRLHGVAGETISGDGAIRHAEVLLERAMRQCEW